MGVLNETSTFPPAVYQLELTDPLAGGPVTAATGSAPGTPGRADGILNLAAQQLASRTRWLADNTLVHAGGIASIQAGALAVRPAPGMPGRLYVVTDATPLPRIDRDTGSAWTPVSAPLYGTNANGTYVRFETGWQMCFHRLTGFGTADGALNSATWTYPAVFSGAQPTVIPAASGSFAGTFVGMSVVNPDQVSTGVVPYFPGQRPAVVACEIFATGRWK